MLAFFIECACPPDRRAASVAAGDITSVEEFMANYHLTHIECQACGTYYELIGYIDESGVERMVRSRPAPASAPRQRLVSSFRRRAISR